MSGMVSCSVVEQSRISIAQPCYCAPTVSSTRCLSCLTLVPALLRANPKLPPSIFIDLHRSLQPKPLGGGTRQKVLHSIETRRINEKWPATDSYQTEERLPQSGSTPCSLSRLAPGGISGYSELWSLAYLAFVEMFKVARTPWQGVPLKTNIWSKMTEFIAYYSKGELCRLCKSLQAEQAVGLT